MNATPFLLAAQLAQLAARVPEHPRLALYAYWLYQLSGQEQHLHQAQLFLRAALAATGRHLAHHDPAFAAVARELAWLNTRLRHEPQLLPGLASDQLEELDQAVFRAAGRLLSGVVPGPGPVLLELIGYLTERQPQQPGTPFLAAIIGRAYPAGRAVQWLSRHPAGQPLGLAGLAGELLLLIRVGLLPVHESAVKALVSRGVQSLLAVRQEVDFLAGHYSIFPDAVGPDWRQPTFSHHLNWQRGDLGQSLLLYRAHGLLHDAELARLAELVGLNTLLRTSAAATGISTPHFPDGGAGLAYLYRCLFQLTGNVAYRGGEQHWLTAFPAATLPAQVPAEPSAAGLENQLIWLGLTQPAGLWHYPAAVGCIAHSSQSCGVGLTS
ncbi:glycoside hydrolase family protein [Hymenobacter persicinus]|uniref:Uncharacterized protein n=1 Tax=Hymenobacter persicinus TaxID=2025506 RepID=A0A4V1ZAF6_9BACT|nr:hypothetical protein [Hymenobacter persicinus]RYU77921.1 hypothetical protein EWM57_16045 [Hymenobacter persicinus]